MRTLKKICLLTLSFSTLNVLFFFGLNNNDTIKDNRKPLIVVVVGTRPEAIKCAPLIAELKSSSYKDHFDVLVLSTGQHREMLAQALTSFGQNVDDDLKLMTNNQEIDTFFGNAFDKISKKLRSLNRVGLVVVQGDTTTALAAALASSYLHVPVAHVEAGLRSYDLENPFPEEINRKVIDSIARLMFAPTSFSREALIREGACPDRIHVTGNTGIDAFFALQSRSRRPIHMLPSFFQQIDGFKRQKSDQIAILITMHRRENIASMSEMCTAIREIVESSNGSIMAVLPVHPNPRVRSTVLKILDQTRNILLVEPISYDLFPHLINSVDIIMTDSGGIQEEGSSIGKPIILMRETTERPEGVYLGTIQKIGVRHADIVRAVRATILNLDRIKEKQRKLFLFGDGKASKRIALTIRNFLLKHQHNESDEAGCSTESLQNQIARTVYSNVSDLKMQSMANGMKSYESYQQRRIRLIERSRPKRQLTMPQIFQLPSKYALSKRESDEFAVTAVVSLYMRTGIVRRWLRALLGQTHPPKIIWIIYFASPIAEQLEKEIETVKNESLIIDGVRQNLSHLLVNKGQMQMKYFGRFQLALQVKTRYVMLFDDDCIPMPRFVEAAMHTINTADYRGILGTKGEPFDQLKFYGPVSKSPVIHEVDVVGGSWLMESEWVKLMFREKMFTWETGEDWQLSANARKYANLRSFVMPVDPNDSSTHSFQNDYFNMSKKGDTTQLSKINYRRPLIMAQMRRGDRHVSSHTRFDKSLMVFVENQPDATLALEVLKDLEDVSISLSVSNERDIDLDYLNSTYKISMFNDFMVGRDLNYVNLPEAAEAAEIMYHFNSAVQQTQSTAVLIIGSTAGTSTVAVAITAHLNNMPIVNLVLTETTDGERVKIIKSMATFNFYLSSSRKEILDEEKNAVKEAIRNLFR